MNEYEMELNAVVNWEDADGNKHTGVLVDTIAKRMVVVIFWLCATLKMGLMKSPSPWL